MIFASVATLGREEYLKEKYFLPDYFDYIVIDEFHHAVNEQYKKIAEYFRLQFLLDDVYQTAISHSKDNPFKRYLEYLEEMEALSAEEESLLQGPGREFINLMETTNMSKVYKMPVLMAFYNHGNVRMSVSGEELLESWKEFFCTGTNWKDQP